VIIGEKSWGLPDPYYALSVLPKAAQIRPKNQPRPVHLMNIFRNKTHPLHSCFRLKAINEGVK
jgi:hypothetical protein